MIDRFLRLVGSVFFSCCFHGNETDLLQPNERETQNRHYYYQYNNSENESDRFQSNRKTDQNRSHFCQYDVENYRRRLLLDSCSSSSDTVIDTNSSASFEYPARSNATPNYLVTNSVSPPTALRSASLSNNLVSKSTASSSVKSFLDLSNEFKNHPLSKTESSAPANSHPTKSVQSSASVIDTNSSASFEYPARSNATPNYLVTNAVSPPTTLRSASLSNNLVGKSTASSSVKSLLDLSNEFKNHPLSKTESSAPANSHPTKSIQSQTSHRPDAVCLPNTTKPPNSPSMQRVPKSNMSKNSQASKSIPTVSPTPKIAFFPINSTKQTNTSSFVQPDAEPSSSRTSASLKTGSGPSGTKDPKNVGKGGTLRYEIPKHIAEMIKKDIVPPVLKMPLSPDTYADYFATLLYAEDFYYEKWSGYLLHDVKLWLRLKENSGLQDQSNNKRNKRDSISKTKEKNYPYVVFEITDVPERRPFLLSRDHVHLKPLDKSEDEEPFHGVLVRVEKSTTILAEFDEDFHRQHQPSKKYDVSFSFNRVCLKRAHRAVSTATNSLLRRILFPKPTFLPSQWKVYLTDRILNHKLAPTPYLIEGPFIKDNPHQIPTWMMNSIKNTVLELYKSGNESRMLICAPKNSTCDEMMRAIMGSVNQSDTFRANAAFREKELVPDDVMPACLFHGECFSCPPLYELKNFRIITSTFISTFRLCNAGLKAGHFSHIFLLEATFAIEPEVIVALADLVSEETVVVVTGFARQKPRWVRSDIGRRHGLSKSFFERLLESEPYRSGSPHFITRYQ